MRATPSLAAATSSGTVSAHAIALAGPTVVTGMNVPRARAASSCSGEPGRAHPDQAAAAPRGLARQRDRLGRVPGTGHRDHQVGGADPAGQLVAGHAGHLDRRAGPADGGERVAREHRAAGAARPGDHDRARPRVRAELRTGRSRRTRRSAVRTCAADEATCLQHAARVARLDELGVVEAEGGQRHPALRRIHPALPSACGTDVCLASSTSSTGMLSRTG